MMLPDIVCQIWLLSYLSLSSSSSTLHHYQQQGQTTDDDKSKIDDEESKIDDGESKVPSATKPEEPVFQNVSLLSQEMLWACYAIPFLVSIQLSQLYGTENVFERFVLLILTTAIIYKLRSTSNTSNTSVVASKTTTTTTTANKDTTTNNKDNSGFKSYYGLSLVVPTKSNVLSLLLFILMVSMYFHDRCFHQLHPDRSDETSLMVLKTYNILRQLSLFFQVNTTHQRVLLCPDPMLTYIALYVLLEIVSAKLWCFTGSYNDAKDVAYFHLGAAISAWLIRSATRLGRSINGGSVLQGQNQNLKPHEQQQQQQQQREEKPITEEQLGAFWFLGHVLELGDIGMANTGNKFPEWFCMLRRATIVIFLTFMILVVLAVCFGVGYVFGLGAVFVFCAAFVIHWQQSIYVIAVGCLWQHLFPNSTLSECSPLDYDELDEDEDDSEVAIAIAIVHDGSELQHSSDPQTSSGNCLPPSQTSPPPSMEPRTPS